MVLNCIVLNCRSVWHPACDVIFHSFPSNLIERNKWLAILPLKRSFFEKAKVCSLHFKETDYEVNGKRLKLGTVPFYGEFSEGFPQIEDKKENSITASSLPALPSSTDQDENISLCIAPIQKIWVAPFEMPSSSHSPYPLRVLPNQDCYNIPTKKPRLLLRNILETDKENITKNVTNRGTSPMQIVYCSKGVQARIKSSRHQILEKRNKLLAQKVLRMSDKINSLKSLVNIVKAYANSSEIENIISGNFSNICKELKKKQPKPQGIRYSDEVKSFALTLHFYSSKAYEYLKKYIDLPHVETLRRSLSTFDCNVGFLSEVIEYLRIQIQILEKRFLKNVALIFDGMALKQDLSYDQKLDKIFGYVDLGKILTNDKEELATEALVIQIVSFTTHFKRPVGYFFIKNSLSGEVLAELLNTAVFMLYEIGI